MTITRSNRLRILSLVSCLLIPLIPGLPRLTHADQLGDGAQLFQRLDQIQDLKDAQELRNLDRGNFGDLIGSDIIDKTRSNLLEQNLLESQTTKILLPKGLDQLPSNEGAAANHALKLKSKGIDLDSQILSGLSSSDCSDKANLFRFTYNPRSRQASDTARQFDQACLRDITDYPEGISRQAVGRSVGILVKTGSGGETAFCTALRVSENRFQTARHCFFSRKTGRMSSFGKSIPLRFVKVYLLEDLNTSYLVTGFSVGQDLSSRRFQTAGDTIQINVDTLGVPMPQVDRISAHVGQIVAIPGINKSAEGVNWRDKLRWSSGPSCYIAEVKPGCMAHFCHTMPGFSGAPILTRAPGTDKLVSLGLHSAPGTVEAACTGNIRSDAVNIAHPFG